MGAYAAGFGLQSEALEELAKWAEWTMGEAMAVTELDSDQEAAARYNADKFWTTKNILWGALSAQDQAGAEKLDFFVHSALAKLEDLLGVLSRTGSTLRTQHEAAALEYAARAQAHGEASGVPRLSKAGAALVEYAERAPAENRLVPDDRMSTAISEASGNLLSQNVLGLPVWAWALGAAALLGLLYLPKGNR